MTEPIIQREGERRIIIELPGVKDPDKAIAVLGKTAMLEFKDEEGNTVLSGTDLKDAREQTTQNNQNEVAIEFTDEGAQKFADLTSANVGRTIAILLDGEVLTAPRVNEPITGGKAVITGSRNLEEAHNLAVLLRSGALPVKVDIIETRTVGPTLGQDSKDKSVFAFTVGVGAIFVFMLLFYRGALPVKVDIIETRTVGPTLGQDSKDKSVFAFTVGVGAIFVFMLLFYRVSGLIANLSLMAYVIILLFVLNLLDATLTLPGVAGIILSIGMAVDANVLIFEHFKEEVKAGKTLRMAINLLDATLTLPGVAGIILSIGMAVDANVLIFEHFKEEVKAGKTLRMAMDSGFKRAFTTIFDSNLTTIIAAAVLFFFGTGPIRGFAITLGLGVVISMFTAITLTQFMLKHLIAARLFTDPRIYGVSLGHKVKDGDMK